MVHRGAAALGSPSTHRRFRCALVLALSRTAPPFEPASGQPAASDRRRRRASSQGMALPDLALPSTREPARQSRRRSTRRASSSTRYPMTGRPDRQLPQGWDDIPGARGCTPETCGFRDHHKDLAKLHAEVFGVSTQATPYQQEMVKRLEVPFEVLSDEHFALTNALRLPTFTVDGIDAATALTRNRREGRPHRARVLSGRFRPANRHADEVERAGCGYLALDRQSRQRPGAHALKSCSPRSPTATHAIRYWAVERLAYLATDAAIAPLLETLSTTIRAVVHSRADAPRAVARSPGDVQGCGPAPTSTACLASLSTCRRWRAVDADARRTWVFHSAPATSPVRAVPQDARAGAYECITTTSRAGEGWRKPRS